MKKIEVKDISKFVELQHKLTREFAKRYPGSKDFRWLLDFPDKGEVQVEGEAWKFVKHGAGLRFMRVGDRSHIVNIHKYFDEPRCIDEWRLLQFFDSSGYDITKDQLSKLLCQMCSMGILIDQGDGQYLFSG